VSWYQDGQKVNIDGDACYAIIQVVKEVCKSSQSKKEAQTKLKSMDKWYDWIYQSSPYMDLP
jgi:fructose/tagatose bisphosphate aldolase